MAGSLFWNRVVCVLADRFSNRFAQNIPSWRIAEPSVLTFSTDWSITGLLDPNLAYVRRNKDPHIDVKRMKDILAQSELARGRTRLAVSASITGNYLRLNIFFGSR
jgi:hypothetical protein